MSQALSPTNPSESAIARVKNPLPVPTECPYCRSSVSIANHSEIYGKAYGDWPWAYLCDGCGAYVGMHPQTAIPLGTLADHKLRHARKECKPPFEKLWRSGALTRSEAYSGLASHLGIDIEACHFGWFDINQCERAREWAIKAGGDLPAKPLERMVERQCHCGKKFLAKKADVKRGWAKSCSKRCAALARKG